MDEIIGFNNLKVGQQVKVKGQPGPQGTFAAFEIEIKPPKEQAAIIGLVQNVDLRYNTLRILDRQITVTDASVITDLNDRLIGMVQPVDHRPEDRGAPSGEITRLGGEIAPGLVSPVVRTA